jgi:hypothetical protein
VLHKRKVIREYHMDMGTEKVTISYKTLKDRFTYETWALEVIEDLIVSNMTILDVDFIFENTF